MCKRIDSSNQMIFDRLASSRGIIGEVSCQKISQERNQVCYPRVSRNDILVPSQSSLYWLILTFYRMYCA